MKIKIRNELIPLNLLAVVLIVAIILLPSNGLRIALGLPFLLFFPGYALVAALFPKKEGMDVIERVVLSFGMSIVVVPLIGLILNGTPWGIRLEPVLYSVTSFIFTTSIIAWLRRGRFPEQERFGIEFQLRLPGWGGGVLDGVLSIILAIAILGALGTLGYVIANPKVGETFTEFYILGLEGKAAGYPKELKVGEEGRLIVGITNREHIPMTYKVVVRMSEAQTEGVEPVVYELDEIGTVALEHNENWEQEVSFIASQAGVNQKVEFLLFKGEEGEPYDSLYLWVNVRQKVGEIKL